MANEPFDPTWPMVIVIEGAALTGKTRLTDFVCERVRSLGMGYRVYSPPGRFNSGLFIKRLMLEIEDGKVAIFDGFHLTVSAAIRRRPFTFTNDVISIEKTLDNMRAIKVCLTLNQSETIRRLADQPAHVKKRHSRWAPVTHLIELLENADDERLSIKPYLQLDNSVEENLIISAAKIARAIENLRAS